MFVAQFQTLFGNEPASSLFPSFLRKSENAVSIKNDHRKIVPRHSVNVLKTIVWNCVLTYTCPLMYGFDLLIHFEPLSHPPIPIITAIASRIPPQNRTWYPTGRDPQDASFSFANQESPLSYLNPSIEPSGFLTKLCE